MGRSIICEGATNGASSNSSNYRTVGEIASRKINGKNNLKVPPKIGRSSLPKWRVEIINWPLLFGLGETKTEAYWDFPVDDSEEEITRKIMLRYGEDVSELIKKGFLVEIFERINESGKII